MLKNLCFAAFVACTAVACTSRQEQEQSESAGKISPIKISDNGRYFTTADGEPFFWLGDTGWLLPSKLDREEAERYLNDRQEKGFNVIQLSVLHTLGAVNAYGDTALVNIDASQPRVTDGGSPSDSTQYDYWDHVDYIIDQAAERNIHMAVVPVWGSNVKAGRVSREQARSYATFLANRYQDRPNIIWLNGGDIFTGDSTETWRIIGNVLREQAPNHLITFHPRGRTQSSVAFHEEPWLDFNMFQSGHRRYDQDTVAAELRYGEDNWRYVQVDYNRTPARPTLDGEPSYEGIVQGLHNPEEPMWQDHDVRRYGYWSVFAGGAGYTYGHNAVMQMYQPTDTKGAFGNKKLWTDALNDPGAGQMVHLKNLMLSKPYFERVPDQSLVAEQGERYNYQAATRGPGYAFIYTYNGRPISVQMGKIAGEEVKASWFDPRTGKTTAIGPFANTGTTQFDPPGEVQNGNDWVLVLEANE